jgi:NitT/TauT family transport system permease protein
MAATYFPSGSLAAKALPIASIATALAAMEGFKHLGLLPIFVPAPSAVWLEIVNRPMLLLTSLWVTGEKAACGFAIAAVIALVAGAIAWLVAALYEPIYNFGAILHSLPLIAATPLLALWLGTGPETQIVIAALSSQFPLLVGAMQGFRAVDERHRELMHTLSATRWQAFRYLVIPSALPYLFVGLKIAAPAAVLGTITAEWAGSEQGIGAMMLYALFSYDTVTVWLSVFAAAGLAAFGYGLVAAAEKLVVRWNAAPAFGD